MKPIHVSLMVAAMSVGMLAVGCGGATPAVDAPDGEMPDDPSGETMDGDAMEGAAPSKSDGIIRDADGDGKPDQDVSTCDGLSKTKCEITSGCAWSADEKCVEASGSMM